MTNVLLDNWKLLLKLDADRHVSARIADGFIWPSLVDLPIRLTEDFCDFWNTNMLGQDSDSVKHSR